MDANDQEGTLPGTRKKVTRDLTSWIGKPRAQQESIGKVLWIMGLAGCGKSAIADTVVKGLRLQNLLGACFFFDRHDIERSDPIAVIRTLVY